MERKIFCDILNSEMELATGCTEPAAVALCAAYAREYLEGDVGEVHVSASVNIIKNAMSAGIPGLKDTGINYAAALGALGGDTTRQLQVIDNVSPHVCQQAEALVKAGHVKMSRKETPEKLYVEVTLKSLQGHSARAVIAASHTNLVCVEKDGKTVLSRPADRRGNGVTLEEMDRVLSIQNIYDFANTADPAQDDLHMIQQAIIINRRIAQEGAAVKFNLHVGQNIAAAKAEGLMSNDLVTTAIERTACGIDARMGGAGVPVVTNSGSGNQGITATVPVITAAEFLQADELKTLRAVTLSNLMAIYIHCHFGLLSALCGATIAGTGTACAITYLLGGNATQIGLAVNNMMGAVTGMLCDGAKSDCALKVSACIHTAFLSAFMAMRDVGVQPNEGIVEMSPEQTIKNFVRLGNDGSPTMDRIILDIMLNKEL